MYSTSNARESLFQLTLSVTVDYVTAPPSTSSQRLELKDNLPKIPLPVVGFEAAFFMFEVKRATIIAELLTLRTKEACVNNIIRKFLP